MRRLIALVPAILVLTAMLPAQAYPLDRQVAYCLDAKPWDGTVRASVKWEFSDTPNQYLLDGFRVNDKCQRHWVQMNFRTNVIPGPTAGFSFYVQPGARQKLNRDVLRSLGVYHRSFFRWSINNGEEQGKPAAHMGPPRCTTGAPTPLVGYILADGTILECSHT